MIVPTYDDSELTTACVESLLAARRRRRGDRLGQRLVARGGRARSTGWPATGCRSTTAPRTTASRSATTSPSPTRPATSSSSSTTTPPSRRAGWPRSARRWPTTTCSAPSRCCSTRAAPIQSAGVAFPTCGGLPHAFLQGFPAEDAVRRRGAAVPRAHRRRARAARTPTRWRCAASTRSSPTAWRTSTSATGWRQRRRGPLPGPRRRARSSTTSRATPGRYDKHLANRRRLPRPLAAGGRAARRRRAVGHPRPARGRPRDRPGRGTASRRGCGSRGRCWSARPGSRSASSPRLRWAIKNAAPAGAGGERWGDTHFAASLAAALRDHGQEVVVDRRPEWDRRHRPPRRRRPGAARAGPPRPQPRAGVAALGDLAPRAGHPRRGARLRPGAGGRPAVGRAPGPRLGAARSSRCCRPPTPSGSTPTPARPDSGRPGALRRQLARGMLRPVVRDALAAGLPLAVYGDLWSGLVPDEVVRGRSIPNDAARRGVPLRRRRPQRPPRRHARRRVRLQPALRRRGQRRPGDHRPGRRAGRAVRPLGPGLRDPRRPAPAGHPRRPRRGLRRRRHPPGRRRPGPRRALLRRPRRPPRRGRPRGEGRPQP